MKRLLAALALFAMATAALAQGDASITKNVLQHANSIFTLAGRWDFTGKLLLPNSNTPPSGDCDDAAEAGRLYWDSDAATGVHLYGCEGAGGWVQQGGASAFSALTSGTNTTAAMVVGAGATLSGAVLDCADPRVFCVGKETGAEYSTICGKMPEFPSTPAGFSCGHVEDPCVAGSALAAMASASECNAGPCVLSIGEGEWLDCPHVYGVGGIYIKGAGQAVTTIRNPITLAQGIAGGYATDSCTMVVSFDNEADPNFIVDGIEISDLTIEDDFWRDTEPALCIGPNHGVYAGAAAEWDRAHIHDTTLIGNSSGLTIHGNRQEDAGTKPRSIIVENNTIIGGAHALVVGEGVSGTIKGNRLISKSSYCDDPNIQHRQVIGWTTTSAGTSTTVVVPATVDDIGLGSYPTSTDDDKYLGRRIVLDDAGTCPAACVSGLNGTRWVTLYDADTFTMTVNSAWGGGCVPSAGCYVFMDPVGGASTPECTRTDWSMWRNLVPGAFLAGYGGQGCIEFVGSTIDYDLAALDIVGNTCDIAMNDFGPSGAAGCDDIAAMVSGAHSSIYGGNGSWPNRVTLEDFHVTVGINAGIRDDNLCANPVAGISVTGQGGLHKDMKFTGSVVVNNPGDSTAPMYAVVVNGTGGGPGAVNIPHAFLDVNNTAPGYSGATAHVLKGASGTDLKLGPWTSDTTRTVSGSPSLLSGATMSGAATINFGSITSTCVEVNASAANADITVAGAAAGDPCHVSAATGAYTPATSSYTCRVVSANTVRVRHCCNNATCDPGNAAFKAVVVKP